MAKIEQVQKARQSTRYHWKIEVFAYTSDGGNCSDLFA